DAGDRCDHGAGAQVVAAIVVLQLGQEDRLVAAAAVEREFDADHVGFLHRDAELAAEEVAADLFEVLHGAEVVLRWNGSGYPSRPWPPCLPIRPPRRASCPRSVTCRAARSPATATSRAAPGCRGGHGW